MQDIRQETLNECTRAEQSASVVLWEIDLTEVGGERYFFCNEQNEKGEPVTWQGRQYQAYPIQGSGFELNGKGTSTRPTLAVSNLYGMVTGMVEDMQSLVGGTVVRRKVYARFLDAVNFVNGNRDADPEQEVISRWRIEQCAAADANHHAAIVTGLSRQLLYIAFAAMAAKQNMLYPWQFKRWRQFGLCRSNGAFAVDPHRARKLFISEKIVQVIETSGM